MEGFSKKVNDFLLKVPINGNRKNEKIIEETIM